MAEATFVRTREQTRIAAAAAVVSGEIQQGRSGRAEYFPGLNAAVLNEIITRQADGQVALPKTTSMVLLDGGRAYWDYSANAVYFRKVNDQDFYLGRVVGDSAAADTTCVVNLNVNPEYDIDIMKDAGISVPVGTAAAGAFGRGLFYHGAGLNLLLSATNEAQKIDWLSKDGFSRDANPIVEFAFSVPTGSAAGGAQDLSIGIASATHATDADQIAKHLFMHFDGNATKINFQSKDGTTTVAATDSTKVIVAGNTNAAGVRVEIWMDVRDPTNCKLYVDGVRVLSGTVFDLTQVTTTTLYLLAHLEKTAATDTAEVDVDFFRARFADQ